MFAFRHRRSRWSRQRRATARRRVLRTPAAAQPRSRSPFTIKRLQVSVACDVARSIREPRPVPRKGVTSHDANDDRRREWGAPLLPERSARSSDGDTQGSLRRGLATTGTAVRVELAGLVRHLALDVERFWFRTIVAGEPVDIDASETESEAWHVPEVMSGSAVLDLYRREIEHANAIIAATVLDSAPTWWPVERWPNWRLQNVRNVVLHVITETACHAGHLDAAGELIDGRTWLVVTDREARCWPCVDQRSAGARPPRARWIQNRRSGSMRSKLRIGPSTVIAVIALFVALGGTAYASSQINGSGPTKPLGPGRQTETARRDRYRCEGLELPKVPYAHMADDAHSP